VLRFLTGFLAGLAVLVLAGATVVHFGCLDVSADAAMPGWFAQEVSGSIHRSVIRQAADLVPLTPATDAQVIAGGKLFVNDCVGCHSEPGKPPSDFGATFYPPAPQFFQVGTRYTEAQIFWVAKHGIRRTGMGAQGESYSDEKLRLLAAFVSRIRTLPPGAIEQIHQKAQAAPEAAVLPK
jgi:cytochrome c553